MKRKHSLPTVYLDTSIFCALHYKGGSFRGIYMATSTRDWWESERHYFGLYTSAVTIRELRQGRYAGQEAAIRTALRLPRLPWSKEVDAHAQASLDEGLVPPNKQADAFQLAFASLYGVDYLMTWNHAHLGNPDVQARLLEMNHRLGLRSPWLVSPDSIPKVALGQAVRRRD